MCELNVKMSEKLDGSSHRHKPINNEANDTGKSKAEKEKQREERERLVLWYEPMLTFKYSSMETVELLRTYGQKQVTVTLRYKFLHLQFATSQSQDGRK